MSTTAKIGITSALALLVAALLAFSPVGISQAQDPADAGTDDADRPEATEPEDDEDRDHRWGPPFGRLSDEEREELREEWAAEVRERRRELAEDLAAELGVAADEVEAAFRAVLEDRLAERVAEGDLTQEQADEILEAHDEGFAGGLAGLGVGDLAFPGHGPRGPLGPGPHHGAHGW